MQIQMNFCSHRKQTNGHMGMGGEMTTVNEKPPGLMLMFIILTVVMALGGYWHEKTYQIIHFIYIYIYIFTLLCFKYTSIALFCKSIDLKRKTLKIKYFNYVAYI